ncbi:MAG: hypothetical protein AABW90_03355 [Nanoarchaeota archaeon]
MENIKVIHATGIDKLTEKEKQLVDRLLNEYYVRIQRQLKNLVSLEFNIKEYKKTGERWLTKKKKFSVHIRINSDKVYEADYGDWDLARTIHKVMNKLINEIEHKQHHSDQHFKIRNLQKVRKR